MAQHYSDPERESDPHALPDIEVFKDRVAVIHCNREQCGEISETYAGAVEATAPEVYCPSCGYHSADARYARHSSGGSGGKWWYAFGFPGCLWDSDPVGPFDSEAEALKGARS